MNWMVVIQLDPKLKTETNAVFAIRSGNIPMSWTITLVVLVALFLAFGTYHKFMLPYPESDKPGHAHNIVAFIKAFFKTFGTFFARPRIIAICFCSCCFTASVRRNS